jgi:S-adenosylmethionine:diacylglycerol 3-amino-3-carboxypropyl transferase
MSDTKTWLNNFVSRDELAKTIEDFDTAFTIAASNFENDGWYVDDCVNYIYDHISENLEHISEEIIKNAIEVVFVENVVDGSASDDSLEDDEQDKKLTQSQRDFMGGTYRNEYDEDEYGDDDDVEIDDDIYDE